MTKHELATVLGPSFIPSHEAFEAIAQQQTPHREKLRRGIQERYQTLDGFQYDGNIIAKEITNSIRRGLINYS